MNNIGYHLLGRTGLRVSPLALGTMTFGNEWGWGADRATAEALFDKYLEAGGNFVDTADLYTNGTSESWLGEMIADRKARDRVVVSTKFSFNAEPGNPNAGGNGRKNIMRAVEGSLRRLKTDYIDLYLLHTWDALTPPEEVMRTFDDLVSSGKVRYVGLSDTPAWYASRAHTIAELRGYERLATMQLEYSLLERNVEHEFVPLAQALDMGLMVWSPLASGLLSGKHKPSALGGGRAEAVKDSTNPAFAKLSDPRVWDVVAALEDVAGQIGRPMAQVALNWVAHRPGVSSVLVGATKLAQLESNLAALEFEIPASLRETLDRVSAPVRTFPYTFFDGEIQQMLRGNTEVRPAPANFR
ncbi:MAG: aldo/keto reductase [Myxococcota bacterium]